MFRNMDTDEESEILGFTNSSELDVEGFTSDFPCKEKLHYDENMREDVTNSEVEENAAGFEKIEQILSMCVPSLIEHLPKFKEAMILNSSIKFLCEKDVSLIFQQEIGNRLIFMDALRRFKKSHPKKVQIVESNENEPKKSNSDFKPFSKWNKIVR